MKLCKRFLALVLALMLVLCLCACTQPSEDATGDSTGGTSASSSAPLNPDDGNTEDQIPDGMVQYKVKVVDEAGNPIVGVYVQLCTEETCLTPVMTDEAGVSAFTAAKDEEYHAKFTKALEGYTADAEDFYFADGKTELTIVLKAVSDSE